jgi:hypothetical protein
VEGKRRKRAKHGKGNKTGKNKGEKGKITKEGMGDREKHERKRAHCA